MHVRELFTIAYETNGKNLPDFSQCTLKECWAGGSEDPNKRKHIRKKQVSTDKNPSTPAYLGQVKTNKNIQGSNSVRK